MKDPDYARNLAGQYLDLKEQIERLHERLADVVALIVDEVEPGEKIDTGNGTGVRVQAPSKRFDPAQAKNVLPADVYESILVAKPDAAQARAVLSGAFYEMCQTSGGKPSVRSL